MSRRQALHEATYYVAVAVSCASSSSAASSQCRCAWRTFRCVVKEAGIQRSALTEEDPMSTGCVERLGDLASYVLDELGVRERTALEEHVRRCPGCLAELRALAPAAELLAVLWPRPARSTEASVHGPRVCRDGRPGDSGLWRGRRRPLGRR